MSDHDALLAAICDQPDEDTPRLAFADWLDENDEPDRAAFVRAQIELARTPAWEPFAVFCRWRRPDWATGKLFRATLPPVDGFQLEWPAEPFRRGFGWWLNVRSLLAWEQLSPSILGRVPVGEMYLWTATLDQWRAFAASPVVPHLRRVHFMTNPIEPMRVLRETPAALGIADIHFERSSGAGMPVVVEDLMRSPLGRVVRGLHFHMGYESLDELVDAIPFGETKLERLSFSTMGFTQIQLGRLLGAPACQSVVELDLRGNKLDGRNLLGVVSMLPRELHTLGLASTTTSGQGFDAFGSFLTVANLRRLDLSRNRLPPRAARTLSRSPHLSALRSLNVSRCQIGERELYHLTRAKFWENLVELDLRDNPIPSAGVRHLLDAPVPPDLTALVLSGERIWSDSRDELRKRYGERVVFTTDG